jgi:hypothetical protein
MPGCNNRSIVSVTIVAAVLLTTPPASAQYISSFTIYRPIDFGYWFVGRDLNGVALNGQILDGHYVDQVSLKNVTLSNGKVVNKLKLDGTRFYHNDDKLNKKELPGTVFQATLDDGRQIPLMVEAVTNHEDERNADLRLYQVTYPTANGWAPLCGYDGSGKPYRAIPLAGAWDYAMGTSTGGSWRPVEQGFTFACEEYIVAKCVTSGYKPWKKIKLCQVVGRKKKCWNSTLADHHQACTRMLRADYCGDGTPHTVDNVDINAYDGLEIRRDTENWTLEAEWNGDGAICVSDSRVDITFPACWTELYDATCGDPENFHRGALIISEYLEVGGNQ